MTFPSVEVWSRAVVQYLHTAKVFEKYLLLLRNRKHIQIDKTMWTRLPPSRNDQVNEMKPLWYNNSNTVDFDINKKLYFWQYSLSNKTLHKSDLDHTLP